MPIQTAIYGPGRLGTALGILFERGGLDLLGFAGRDKAATAAAVRRVPRARALAPADLARAAVVVVTVSDSAIEPAVEALVRAGAVRPCSLWIHCSGGTSIEALKSVEKAGGRTAVLHPLAPVPDLESGLITLPGAPALLVAPERSQRLARRVAQSVPFDLQRVDHHDPALYHAACALASNGVTALLATAERELARATGLDLSAARLLATHLAGAALSRVAELGPGAALSGPVERGDTDLVRRHLEALEKVDPQSLALYRASMLAVLRSVTERRGARASDEDLRRVLTDPDR